MASAGNIKNTKGLVKQFVSERRNWWHTDFGKKYFRNQYYGFDFTVMSYNILSQKLLEAHKYLYHSCKRDHLKWHYRSENLLKEIVMHNADIICLQEVQEDHYFETILPHLTKHGYKGLYKKKTGDKFDGCAILFKAHIFRLHSCSAIEFHNSSIHILDRDNIGLIALFQPIDQNFKKKKLCVATTHLLFNPKRGDIKLAQLRVLLAEIERFAVHSISNQTKNYYPVILCGDLNSNPYSPLYDFIVDNSIKFENMLSGNVGGQFEGHNKGKFLKENDLSLMSLGINHNTQYENIPRSKRHLSAVNHNFSATCGTSNTANDGIGIFSHPFHFVSAYRHAANNGLKEVTNLCQDSICTTDYIFYSTGNIQKSHKFFTNNADFKHLGSYGLLYANASRKMPQAPNAYLSSDHICLISQFLFKP